MEEQRKKNRVGLTRKALAQFLDRCRLLLLPDLLVLLLVRRGLEALPWQAPAQKVHEDVTERLEVVPSGLFCVAYDMR